MYLICNSMLCLFGPIGYVVVTILRWKSIITKWQAIGISALALSANICLMGLSVWALYSSSRGTYISHMFANNTLAAMLGFTWGALFCAGHALWPKSA